MTATAKAVTISTPPKPSICLVAHFAYGMLTGGSNGHIGGVEKQTTLMARWLASRGYRVSLITWDEGQPDGVMIDGVSVFKVCRRDAGVPGLRFIHPRWTSLNRALGRADADVYYQNCGESITGQVALWCRRHGRRFLFSSASNHDCVRALPFLRTLRERVLYRYGLRAATRLVVQTRWQQRRIQEDFGRTSIVIPMPCPGPTEDAFVPPRPPDPSAARVLWVGRLTQEKRPDRFLDLVEACPDLLFDLVGPAYDDVYSRPILDQARRLPNLTIHGPKTPEALAAFYRRAACLCCTSDAEGFPNTFLEAWSHGIPVVTTFDPDAVVRDHGLGAAADDVENLARAIRALVGAPARWRAVSASARQFYVDNHSVEQVMPRFEEAFLDAASQAVRAPERGRR